MFIHLHYWHLRGHKIEGVPYQYQDASRDADALDSDNRLHTGDGYQMPGNSCSIMSSFACTQDKRLHSSTELRKARLELSNAHSVTSVAALLKYCGRFWVVLTLAVVSSDDGADTLSKLAKQ